MKILQGFMWRLARTAIAIGIAGAATWAANDPRWIWLAPLITATGKALRDKFGFKYIPF